VLLDARIPEGWPPPLNDESSMRWMLRYMEANPGADGWTSWYFLLRDPQAKARAAIENGGFKGRPTADGTVEIGYSLMETHHGKGYGAEATRALVGWAFSHPEIRRVVAHTLPELGRSIHLLEKCGFTLVGPGTEEGAILFELPREVFERPVARAAREPQRGAGSP